MIRVNLVKPKKFDAISFDRRDLLKIGAKAIDVIQKRCARAQNVKDKPAKKLSKKWADKKKAIGQPPVRNLMHSGSMLGALTITEATNNSVTIGFTRQAELAKALANDNRDPWFGLSKSDEEKVSLFADSLLRNKAK